MFSLKRLQTNGNAKRCLIAEQQCAKRVLMNPQRTLWSEGLQRIAHCRAATARRSRRVRRTLEIGDKPPSVRQSCE